MTAVAAATADLMTPVKAQLRQLVLLLGDSLIEVIAAPRGAESGEPDLCDVSIVGAGDDLGECAGELVLVVGARGGAAMDTVRQAADHGAVAVAVKMPADGGQTDLWRMATQLGIPVLGVRPEVQWSQLYALARGFLADARLATADDQDRPADLFSLAQTVAALTGGSVTIEDTTNRVLAYSRSDDEIDELRRLSILGWQTPPEHVRLLRRWGVFDGLRSGEDVVHVDARAELGISRRMVVGIHADRELLGSIWLQEGSTPLAPGSETVLRGAARTAALQLVRRRTGGAPTARLDRSLLSWMFDGNIDPRTFADYLGADREQPAVITVFTTCGGVARPARDRSSAELQRAMLTNLVSVHASARRRSSFVVADGTRVYLLVSGLTGGADKVSRDLAEEVVLAASRTLGLDVAGAVGSVVSSLDLIADSKADAERVLDILLADGKPRVAAIGDVRGEALVREALALIRKDVQLRDPRITALIAYDAEYDADLVPSLRAFLGRQCNVRAAARDLHVHPNTLRYRIKRAETVSGLNFDDPYECLFTNLQLMLGE